MSLSTIRKITLRLNMEEPKPIQDALDVFGKVLDEIETLI